ncbi:hypothetical protein LCGC14_1845790 [marine sediment metagenome]|uniref:Uncharacterized protein n=1 Tax=marine sediment metagenome TaxID=412755 RepID=A0A0F9GC69_9ZZZZ
MGITFFTRHIKDTYQHVDNYKNTYIKLDHRVDNFFVTSVKLSTIFSHKVGVSPTPGFKLLKL